MDFGKRIVVRIWDLEIQEWEIITWDHDLGSGIWYWDGYMRRGTGRGLGMCIGW